MNKVQRIILLLYCLTIVAILIYSPYNLTVEGYLIRSEYSWIWEPIMYGSNYGKTPVGVIDTSKILIQMLGATLISTALTFMFKGSKI